jgi:hypothetical protein
MVGLGDLVHVTAPHLQGLAVVTDTTTPTCYLLDVVFVDGRRWTSAAGRRSEVWIVEPSVVSVIVKRWTLFDRSKRYEPSPLV